MVEVVLTAAVVVEVLTAAVVEEVWAWAQPEEVFTWAVVVVVLAAAVVVELHADPLYEILMTTFCELAAEADLPPQLDLALAYCAEVMPA